jgi:hypothetical protein
MRVIRMDRKAPGLIHSHMNDLTLFIHLHEYFGHGDAHFVDSDLFQREVLALEGCDFGNTG